MPSITFSVELPSDLAINGLLLGVIAKRLAAAFQGATKKIAQRVGKVSADAIKHSPEYTSLLSGDLRGQLGVINPEPVIQKVCDNIANGVVVTSLGARVQGNQINGGLTIELLKGDYSEVLNAPGASFQSEGGYQIDWLKWLTTSGDQIIIANYGYVANGSSRSRTGLGIMSRPGVWRIPPQFSGSISDNWITRALATAGPAVEAILFEEITRGI